MGLRGPLKIRQYVDFDVDGKMFRVHEITFRTEKTEGEFVLDIPSKEFTAEHARELAEARAEEIDKAVG
ncbi:unnamed protein product [marine sediment metagenome]|uniref:Uncharacterized protein n=1 Tax=marine sediment metagenome TaxID=412755 RepID=X1III7_9ZZZZ